MYAEQRMNQQPQPADGVATCVLACLDCAASCVACAEACRDQPSPDLARCLRLSLDCAALCRTFAEILWRGPPPDLAALRATLEAVAATSAACARECEGRGPHFEDCAEACRRCEVACRALLG